MRIFAARLFRRLPLNGSSIRRPLKHDDAEISAILALLQACEAHDRLEESYSTEEIRQDFFELEPGWQSAAAVWERDGEFDAAAGIWAADDRSHDDSIFGWYNIHPNARDVTMQRTVLEWITGAAKPLAGPVTDLELSARETSRWRIQFLVESGFREVRRFDRMKLPLTDLPEPAQPPPGYTIRTLAGGDEVAAWVDVFNASFIDHYGFVPMTVEGREMDRARSGYDPELDFVAVAPDGTFAAFCWCDVRTPDGAPVEYWVHLLGTHREHRRQGLATALLDHALRALSEKGASEARLAVDQQSSTGASSMYERAGFVSFSTSLAFRRSLADF